MPKFTALSKIIQYLMKSKIHIDIGTYEFVEFEKEGEFTSAEIMNLWQKFHKLTDKAKQNKVEKVNKHKQDFIEDLELPDEPLNLNVD